MKCFKKANKFKIKKRNAYNYKIRQIMIKIFSIIIMLTLIIVVSTFWIMKFNEFRKF